MIIRSQDKKSITTDLNMEIYVDDKKSEYVIGNVMRGRYGTYSTEEKAIKVLDMICKAYENYRGGNVYEHSIFNMPSDEEVEV